MNIYQYRVLKNALVVLFVGLIGGFFFTYKLLQVVVLPPLPLAFETDIPGTVEAWRAVHLGNLMNAIMAMAMVPLFGWAKLSEKQMSRISWALILTIWGNAFFYVFAVFSHNRGLTAGANRFGEGNWAAPLAALPALVAAYALLYATVALFLKLKRP